MSRSTQPNGQAFTVIRAVDRDDIPYQAACSDPVTRLGVAQGCSLLGVTKSLTA